MKTLAPAMWRARLPPDMLPLIVAVAVGGTAAGFLAAMPVLFVTSPAVAIALAIAATFMNPVPAWQRGALEVLRQLPAAGQGRALLSDLLRRASVVPSALVAYVEPLVSAAADAARQLSALELHLAAFDAQQATNVEKSARWHDALERCKQGSDLLAGRLQDASAALSRWQAAQGSGENLAALARGLNEESRYQQEAAEEVEALLIPTPNS
ncbi:MAG TPA: hypothetical protein VKD28_04220 [Gemmatimonadales bacterium]|nr:hypothetical protein [Gemmatimonadales bacterium]